MCQGEAMARPVGPTVVIRSRSSVALAIAMIASGVVGVVLAATAGADSLRAYSVPPLLFALLGWAAFWHPYVEVSDGGVHVVNTWRGVHVPWPTITEVEGSYGLRLRTRHGTVTAWAAPAPRGRARARSEGSEAAQVVLARQAELRAEGYLDRPALEQDALTWEWDVPLMTAAGVLLVASVVLLLLG
jgi:Bacterial PH domain